MNKIKAIALSIIVLVILIVIAFQSGLVSKLQNRKEGAVSENPGEMTKYTATFFDIFDTRTELLGYAYTEDEFTEQANLIKERLIFYNNLYDIYNDYDGINNIRTINENAGVAPVEVDPEIINLIKFSKDIYEETDGKVNIAMGSVLQIWHDYREHGMNDPETAELPTMEELTAAAEHTNIEDVIIDEKAGTVYLADPEMSLDVGSTGKGYAVQRVMDYCKQQGMNNILMSLGGNVGGVGTRIDGTPFKIAIQNPDMDSEEKYIETVTIEDGQCVVSSGDYQRYYVVDGKTYCHIIDPDTLFPNETFAAVSIITDDSGKADAYSTALYNMTIEEGLDFVNSHDNLEAMWVYHDGTKAYSDHFEDAIAQ
ncbi:MAG: FAD:protein FMN transferase [Pseudobutyrivibrio sp.]|nr:FAD:protein FMN transferase [Pseudobutyrivibrio sp.]